mmetsp:Transcript_1871/g.2884  ORF Transcript_1871/g.2884 Transcript_1871/m.2884 type:complete len:93 (-) Transcript_1871:426-704(-)
MEWIFDHTTLYPLLLRLISAARLEAILFSEQATNLSLAYLLRLDCSNKIGNRLTSTYLSKHQGPFRQHTILYTKEKIICQFRTKERRRKEHT